MNLLLESMFFTCSPPPPQWMPFEEYAAQPFVQKTEIFKYITDLCIAKIDNRYTGFSPRATASIFRDDLGYLYLNRLDLDQSKVDVRKINDI